VSETVASDFASLNKEIEPHDEPNSIGSMPDSDELQDNIAIASISDEEINAYISFISKRSSHLDKTTLNIFNSLKSYYTSDSDFIKYILRINEREELPPELIIEDEQELYHLLDFIYDIKTSSDKYSFCDELFVRCDDRR
jgi:hypothetical protein